MNTQNPFSKSLHWAFWFATLLCAFPAQADPIELPEKPVAPEIVFLVGLAILLEAVCILLLLRNFRKPRWFILWIIGLHLITYPAFLGLLWLLQDIRPVSAAGLGEIVMVIAEGTMIYLICRFVPSKRNLPDVSLVRSWMASLAGNACSLVAFPLLMKLYDNTFGA